MKLLMSNSAIFLNLRWHLYYQQLHTLKNFASSGTLVTRNPLMVALTDGSKIFLPIFLKIESGSFIELVSIPNAQEEIMSVVNLAAISFISTVSPLLAGSLSKFLSSSLQSTKIGNIIFILPEVKVGDSFVLRLRHLTPPMEKRWAKKRKRK